MTLSEFQEQSYKYDINKEKKGFKNALLPLLGLSGEIGSLSAEYKKKERDDNYKPFDDKIEEDLGDLLWYLSNLASKLDIDLESVAQKNLQKVSERKDTLSNEAIIFDKDRPENEQFPKKLTILILSSFDETLARNTVTLYRIEHDEKHEITFAKSVGDEINDNAIQDDNFRFHDVIHFAFMTYLHWSPVMRKLLNCKRRDKADLEHVQDGGRASLTEESIALLTFNNAKERDFFKTSTEIEYNLLKIIKDTTQGYEVSVCTVAMWQHALLEGYKVFNQVVKEKNGYLDIDLVARKMLFRSYEE